MGDVEGARPRRSRDEPIGRHIENAEKCGNSRDEILVVMPYVLGLKLAYRERDP